jgi:hypothetical protein
MEKQSGKMSGRNFAQFRGEGRGIIVNTFNFAHNNID